ncbi:MAG: hypothetical protein F4185_02810 [Chloroflexi bacterium]|nr:hypothetical protein [Chloroflexota bacterium]MYF64894.1 hypothetical protein [Chloroflexota bacterium]MYK35660.1 hypothetical protein [Chloroflexota bacterium]
MGTRLLALYLMLTGLAVAVYFIAVSWQYPGADQPYPVEPYPVWEVLHWFMAVAILIALLSVFAVKLRLGPGEAVREHLSVNALFYALLGLGLLFFRSWPSLLRGGDYDLFVWGSINMVLPVVLAAVGMRLWRGSRTKEH